MFDRIRREPVLVSGFVQAVLGLLLAFGVQLSLEQTGAILAVTAAGLAFVARSVVTPVAKPKRNEGGFLDRSFLYLLAAIALTLCILALLGVDLDINAH